MDLKTLLKNVEYGYIREGNAEITGISIDSREVRPGDLFFCIAGLHNDSHLFLNDVLKRGAAAIIAERLCEADGGAPVAIVRSSREALSRIAVDFYGDPSASFNLIGVTGTNGKTSVTYLLEAILNEAGRRPGVIGTLNARVNGAETGVSFKTSTTPDTPELLKILEIMRSSGATDVCMEVSSHSLALNKVDGLKFKIGIFTNLTQDHLDFHHTMEEYKRAKKRLFSLCGTGIINRDDETAGEFIEGAGCGVLTYGTRGGCDIKAYDIEHGTGGVKFSADIYGAETRFELNVPMRFTVYNALAAIGAAVVLKIPADRMRSGLKNFTGVPGRAQSVPNDLGVGIIVDYAHTPDALYNVLRSARELCAGKLITVFGCGGDKDRSKRPVMGRIAGELSDRSIITSDNPRSEEPMDIIAEIERGMIEAGGFYEIYEDRRAAIYAAVSSAKRGDTVVIAGKGHEEYQEFKDRTIRFADAEVAAAAARDAGAVG